MTSGRFRLIPQALVSVPVFGFSVLWVSLVQVGEGAAAGESAASIPIRLTLLFAVQILMFAFPYLTWRLICPRVRERNWTWLLLVALLVGAVVRGVALGFLLTLVGLTNSPELVFRIVASLTHMAVVVVLLWVVVSEVRGVQSRRRQLLTEREQLMRLQEAAQRDLAHLSDRATDEIRRSILDSLGGLQATNSSELGERLRVTIDDVVRPLSHYLAAQPSAWTAPPASRESSRVDWSLAFREGLDPARIHPVIVPIVLIWLGLPIHLFRFGPTITAAYVATVLVAIPAFWLARKVAIGLTAGRSAGAKATAFVIAVLFGGAVLGLATLPYMQDEPQPFVFVAAAPLLALLISAPWAIAESARDQNRELESGLRESTADLRWTLVRARERYRQREGALAHALHGRLQASLAAAYLRLDRAVAQGADDATLLVSLQAEVLESIQALDVLSAEPDPIDKLITLTQSNWSGAADLNFTVGAQARDALAGDPLCARAVNDLIPELVFNSIRHGGATAIDVRLEVADARTLSLSVGDNGSGDLTSSRYGLGSTLLDEATVHWTRSRSETGTTTTCLLPFLNSRSALVNP